MMGNCYRDQKLTNTVCRSLECADLCSIGYWKDLGNETLMIPKETQEIDGECSLCMFVLLVDERGKLN